MVKQGDTVEVGGAVATIETIWGQGKHTMYRLSDGREILDLHAAVEAGTARVVPLQRKVTTKPLRVDLDALKREVDELQ